MAHLGKVLDCLAQKSQNHFDGFVTKYSGHLRNDTKNTYFRVAVRAVVHAEQTCT